MAFPFARIVLAVLCVAVALFLFHLLLVPPPGSHEMGLVFPDRTYAFENSRKNYASVKVSAPGLPIGDSQKYEKIASVTQVSANFDADRRLIEGRIPDYGGVTQLERVGASRLQNSTSRDRRATRPLRCLRHGHACGRPHGADRDSQERQDQ